MLSKLLVISKHTFLLRQLNDAMPIIETRLDRLKSEEEEENIGGLLLTSQLFFSNVHGRRRHLE